MKKIIFSTDWGTDCDDVMALRLLSTAVRRGEAEILGIVINEWSEYAAASLLGFLDYEGLSGVPVAIDRDAVDYGGVHRYQKRLAENYGKNYTDADCEEPVAMMRRLLAASDGGVDVIEVGYPQCLAALLESEGDANSPLDGCALVAEKVSCLWQMAGNFVNEERGSEHNLNVNGRCARGGSVVCERWPTPVIFLGWEVGVHVISGGHLPPEDPLAAVMADFGHPNGRASWDPMTALAALYGSPEAAGYDAVRGHVTVNPVTGENSFRRDPLGHHAYLVKKYDDAHYAAQIDAMLVRP